MLNRVKRFIKKFTEICRIINKVSQYLGAGVDVLKVVDTVVDSFIEQKRQGKLKDADFFDYASAVCELIGKLSDAVIPLGDVVDNIIDLFDAQNTLADLNGSPRARVQYVSAMVEIAKNAIENARTEQAETISHRV